MKYKKNIILFICLIFVLSTAISQKVYQGYVTYYGRQAHGKSTASGERINMNDFVAAHRSLPFGTRVKVTNKSNHKSIIIRVIDRCSRRHPFHFLDLSYGAAKHLDFLSKGRTSVTLQILDSVSIAQNHQLLAEQNETTSKWTLLDSLEVSSRNALLLIPDSSKVYGVVVGSYPTRKMATKKAQLFTKIHRQKTIVRDIFYKKRHFSQVIALNFSNLNEAEDFRKEIVKKIRGARVVRIPKVDL